MFVVGITPALSNPDEIKTLTFSNNKELVEYLERYRITTLDYSKNELYNYYIDNFQQVLKIDNDFQNNIDTVVRYLKQAPGLKKKNHADIAKIVILSDDLKKQKKWKVQKVYEAFSKNFSNFSNEMNLDILEAINKLDKEKLDYFFSKSILQKTLRHQKDQDLLQESIRYLQYMGKYEKAHDFLDLYLKDFPKDLTNVLRLEIHLSQGKLRKVKKLMDKNKVDFNCVEIPKTFSDLMMRKNVAIYKRLAGEFKESLECLGPLQKNTNTEFFYYFDGLKASRLISMDTSLYMFKKAAQLANRKASVFYNAILDWEEIKNDYFRKKFSKNSNNLKIKALKGFKFEPILMGYDILEKNINSKDEEVVKHPKLKYLEILDVLWIATIRKVEDNRSKIKKAASPNKQN